MTLSVNNTVSSNDPSKVHAKKEGSSNNSPNSFFLAWYALYQSVATELKTSQIQADELDINAKVQQKLNNQIASVNYAQINSNLKGNELTKEVEIVQAKNQQAQAQIDYYTNENVLERQNAQVTSTQGSTTGNNIEETITEASSFLQAQTTMTNQMYR